MKTCLRCGCQTVDEVNFCPVCGQPLAPSAQYTQTPPPAGYYPPPAPPAKPKPPALAKSIISMVLSISALECAAVGLLLVIYISFVFGLLALTGIEEIAYDSEMLFVKSFFSGYIVMLSLIMGGIGLATGLVGRHLGLKAKEAGNQSKMAHFGVKLGNISWILSVAMLAIGAIAAILLWCLI